MSSHVNRRRRVIPRPTCVVAKRRTVTDRPFNRRSADYRPARSPATGPSAVRRPQVCSSLL